jgi:hypothetical protein
MDYVTPAEVTAAMAEAARRKLALSRRHRGPSIISCAIY